MFGNDEDMVKSVADRVKPGWKKVGRMGRIWVENS